MSLSRKLVIKEQPSSNSISRIDKFAKAFLTSVIFILSLFIFYLVITISLRPLVISLLLFLCSIFMMFLFSKARKWREEIKIKFSLVVITIGACVYLAEIYLQFNSPVPRYLKETVRRAKERGITYDTRKKFEVIEDLRKKGIDAYPPVFPSVVSGQRDNIEGKWLLPLGGISLETTLLGNESGTYSIYISDEHGFNNPHGLYTDGELDFLLLGDSFIHGCFVEQSETISEQLREEGYRTLNLGYGGNGPFMELATIKEYGEILKPKIVLWFFFEGNDLHDIVRDEKDPILMKYLKENYSQGLFYKQSEIDEFLISFVEKREPSNPDFTYLQTPFMRIARLVNIRDLLINIMHHPPVYSLPTIDCIHVYPLLEEILKKANNIVLRWGGRLCFVYLPMRARYLELDEIENYVDYLSRDQILSIDEYREQVLSIVGHLNIPKIDIHNEVFIIQSDPLSLFPYELGFHYNSRGYEMVAKAIARSLRKFELTTGKTE